MNKLVDAYIFDLLTDLEEFEKSNYCVTSCRHKTKDNPDPHAHIKRNIDTFLNGEISISDLIESEHLSHIALMDNDSSKADKGRVKKTDIDRAAIVAERQVKKLAKKNKGKVETAPETKEETPKNNDVSNLDRAAILAEREAKKLAKKNKANKIETSVSKENKVANTSKCSLDNKQNTSELKITEEMKKKMLIKQQESTESISTKSKSELRAERRAIQEAQRAAKTNQKPVVSDQKPTLPAVKKTLEPTVKFSTHVSNTPLLFNHLYVQRVTDNTMMNLKELHPSIIRLGLQYKSGTITGSNARCLAMLAAFKAMINSFNTSSQEIYGRSLEAMIQKSMTYLKSCRPIAVSMTNTLRFLKFQLTQLPNNISNEDGKTSILNAIDTYIREEINVAGEAISSTVQPKIHNGDIILTLSYSSLIYRILVEARQSGKDFQVIVVESKLFKDDAIEMVRRLVKIGIKCEYCLITSVSCQMRRVDIVLLGAHAILANGYVMSRIGSAQVALVAKAFNKPVLVCCETYKSSERVQTDSFVYNEIAEGNRATLILNKDTEYNKTSWTIPLNLTYDVTPPDLITAVVTELAILPCTSVPVILRVKPTDS